MRLCEKLAFDALCSVAITRDLADAEILRVDTRLNGSFDTTFDSLMFARDSIGDLKTEVYTVAKINELVVCYMVLTLGFSSFC